MVGSSSISVNSTILCSVVVYSVGMIIYKASSQNLVSLDTLILHKPLDGNYTVLSILHFAILLNNHLLIT